MRVLLILAVALSGCAGIVNTSTQTVTIATNPPGGKCQVDGKMVTAPAKVELYRKYNYSVMCHLDGYDTAYGTISGRLSGWVFLNLIPLIGMAYDYSSGAAFNLHSPIIPFRLTGEKGDGAITSVSTTEKSEAANSGFGDCPSGTVFQYGQCYPMTPIFGSPKPGK